MYYNLHLPVVPDLFDDLARTRLLSTIEEDGSDLQESTEHDYFQLDHIPTLGMTSPPVMNPHPLQPQPLLPPSHQPFSFASMPQLFQGGDDTLSADSPMHAASAISFNDPWAVADSNLPKAPPRTVSLHSSSFTTADYATVTMPEEVGQPAELDTPVHRARHSMIHISPSGPKPVVPPSPANKDRSLEEEEVEMRHLSQESNPTSSEKSVGILTEAAEENRSASVVSETDRDLEVTPTPDVVPQDGSDVLLYAGQSNPSESGSNIVTNPAVHEDGDSRETPAQTVETGSNLTAMSLSSQITHSEAPPPSNSGPNSHSHSPTNINNEAPPKSHTPSPSSHLSSSRPPIETSLDTGLRHSPKIGQKSPKAVRRSNSSANTSPVLRPKKTQKTPEHRPTSEFVVLEPLSPEHGQELNQQYDFLRRTLSHSQRRYSQRGRNPNQRKNRKTARGAAATTATGENSNIATSGLVQNQVAPSSSSNSRPPSSNSGPANSGDSENLSRDARQRQAIGQLQSIVRESDSAVPTTSSRREGLEERVDQHGRVYYMNHLTRTIAFGNRGGADQAETTPTQADMQTRREMLDRRWASYEVF